MELKPGYKLTEMGMIPQDWEIHALGGIASIAAGGTPSRRIAEYWNGEIPWVTTTEINFNTITATEQQISRSGLNNSAAKLLHPGTLLLALYGQGKTRGKTAILGIEAATNQACASIVLSGSVSRDYIFHSLASRYETIRKLSNSGSQENLNGQIVRSLLIPLPPVRAEQEAIAGALSDADALIESLERLIIKKRHLKQGAMQELLTGKKRLPGFERKSGHKHTEVGMIPEDWEVVTVSSVADHITVGFVGSMAHLFTHQGIPLLRGQNVLPNKLELNDCRFISTETHRRWSKSALQSGDVVLVRVGYPGSACVIPPGLGESNAASLVVVRPNCERLSAPFLSFLLNSEFGKRQIESFLVGGAQQVLNVTTAAIFKLPLPTKAEQTAIAAILSNMDTEIASLEAKLTKTRQIKQGMMQELLTGKIRLI